MTETKTEKPLTGIEIRRLVRLLESMNLFNKPCICYVCKKEVDPNKAHDQASVRITFYEQICEETYFDEGVTDHIYFCGYGCTNSWRRFALPYDRDSRPKNL